MFVKLLLEYSPVCFTGSKYLSEKESYLRRKNLLELASLNF